MKPALAWLKNNLIAVVAGALCLLSLVFLLVVHARGNAFITAMKDREKEANKIQQYTATQVTIPPEDIDKPARIQSITVNRAAIDALAQVYADMNNQYKSVFEIAVQQNLGRHYLLLEGLLPDPGADVYKPYDARRKYLQAFEEMMQPYSPNALYPRLNPRGPLSADAVKEQLDQVTEAYLNEQVPRKEENALNMVEARELKARRDRRWLEALRNHAKSCHVYAQAAVGAGDFPFEMGAWARGADLPRLHDIWESQLNLWIQQDIVEVIGRTNRVDDSNYYVTIAPVKRLIRVEIVPGYVGINTAGGLPGATGGGLGPPTSGEVKLPDDFSKSPTGRRSNTIYDIRHVKLDMVVDVQRLPEFFDNLLRVNFMTVLHMDVVDVDEYAALQQGYMLGTGDAVQVKMLIETIWLRDWTTRYMPETVRTLLNVPAPAPAAEKPGA